MTVMVMIMVFGNGDLTADEMSPEPDHARAGGLEGAFLLFFVQ